ncbi:uncharacterized protein LOC128549387 [Mercenaria mercenaria]|uniref:uncharacterized protein LOC128549387 n=1 Tax=Mercenaria mercenaria TaxID=6596 RepID=UPI00234E8E35|nr:uncharacterized protein LOC128549387 [Mercenaria mercenaria]
MHTSQSDAVILIIVQKVTWSRFRTNIISELSTMAASEPFQYIELNENEVPGAKFVYESIEKHSNTQLSRWLECRGLRKTGNRSEILKRVHSCISAGKDKEIDVGVDCGKWYELKKESKLQLAGVPSRVPLLPYCGWGKFPSCQEKMPKLFNKGHIHHHIVESVQFVNAKIKLWSTEKVTSAALSYGVKNETEAIKCYKDLKNSERLKTINTGLWSGSC